MNWPAYSEYKDSGTEWLGSVPSHWSKTKLKWSVSLVTSGSRGWAQYYADDGDYFVRIGNLCRGALDFDDSEVQHVQIPAGAEGSRTMTRSGDLLLSITAYLGSVAVVDSAHAGAYVSQHVALARLMGSQVDPRYAGYVALSEIGQRQLNEQAYGGTKIQLSLDDIRSLELPLPDAREQRLIANFLDQETAKIDELIAKQEQLIATLREDRIATITHAVSNGLDPDAPMVDSGTEWIGEVPARWTVTRLGRLCRSISDGPHFSPSYVDDGVMFLSARNIKVDGWSLDDAKFISEEDYKEFSRRVVPEVGDVLYTKGGTTGIARAVDFTQRFQIWVHVAVLKLRRSLVAPDYLAYALNSRGCYEQSQLYTRGATNQDLGLTRMVRILLALPPPDEQREIVEFLNERCENIDMLIAKSNQVIETLREYRSALITDAVTGKIDVRDAA